MLPLRFLLLFAMVVQSILGAITPLEANYFSYLNGMYNNKAQNPGPETKRDLVQTICSPVRVRALQDKPVIFLEEWINGKLARVVLRSVEEMNGIIFSKTYKITKPSLYHDDPEFFNITDVESCTRDEIVEYPDCTAQFELEGQNFEGGWQDCMDKVNEQYAMYGVTLNCYNVTITMPVVAHERSTVIPYNMVPFTKKFPLIDAPENFKPICDRDAQ